MRVPFASREFYFQLKLIPFPVPIKITFVSRTLILKNGLFHKQAVQHLKKETSYFKGKLSKHAYTKV